MEKVKNIRRNGGGGAASSGNSSSNKVILDRKTAERNRRIHMKGLCFGLTSLIPPHHFKPSREVLSQQDQLDQVAVYIKQLKDRVDELMVKKKLASMSSNGNGSNKGGSTTTISSFIMPVVELRELGSSNIEVILISGLQKKFSLCDIIFLLQEEGTDVIGINMSTVGDRVFHTLHAQVKVCRVGVDTTRIWQRLQQVMCLAYLYEEIPDCYYSSIAP